MVGLNQNLKYEKKKNFFLRWAITCFQPCLKFLDSKSSSSLWNSWDCCAQLKMFSGLSAPPRITSFFPFKLLHPLLTNPCLLTCALHYVKCASGWKVNPFVTNAKRQSAVNPVCQNYRTPLERSGSQVRWCFSYNFIFCMVSAVKCLLFSLCAS